MEAAADTPEVQQQLHERILLGLVSSRCAASGILLASAEHLHSAKLGGLVLASVNFRISQRRPTVGKLASHEKFCCYAIQKCLLRSFQITIANSELYN